MINDDFILYGDSPKNLINKINSENVYLGDIYKCTYYWCSIDEKIKNNQKIIDEAQKYKKLYIGKSYNLYCLTRM